MTQQYNAYLNRFSSRLHRLSHVYLKEKLQGAKSYCRIAGYFRSSIFELIHEEVAQVGKIRIVCNSDLDPEDIRVAQSVRDRLLKEKWNEVPTAVDAILNRERYRRLHEVLSRGNVEIRVISSDVAPFVHGKAGVIEAADGSKSAFIGSLNETRHGWGEHYELLWEDTSPEGVAWVEAEFEYLWNQGIPLPNAIIREIDRCANRKEFNRIEDCPEEQLPAATLVESPIYQRGENLMPWQQAFVGMFMEHRQMFGAARLLLADEVGLGKTLSLACSALMSCLLNEGPVLILCPANLTFQWQTELWDKLGIPSAVWTNKKTWQDHRGHHIKTRGAEDIINCPYQIGIVSTGLIFRETQERGYLLQRSYGILVLDEAHRARRTGGDEPNNLLRFIREAATQAKHVLLGTATPIQTNVEELWDLLEVLGQGADYVLGAVRYGSRWRHFNQAFPLVTGEKRLHDELECWEWIRNPLPSRQEDSLYDHIRADFGLRDNVHYCDLSITQLEPQTREELNEKITESTNGLSFFQCHNPVIRHTVLRQRKTLEERGLLDRVAVEIHPNPENSCFLFDNLGLRTSAEIDWAYSEAIEFTNLLVERTQAAGFMKGLILQRICSSVASGISTARKLLDKETLEEIEDNRLLSELEALTQEEKWHLEKLIQHLSKKPEDPKFEAVVHYLLERDWLTLGCIIFSQYYDTAAWVAQNLALKLPHVAIALYAGADQSKLFREGVWARVEREDIKKAVKAQQVRLVVATDAACEGLNLQTLGTLINIDLPWNPSRLEQRLGRIKRFGQRRHTVDMLNLVYQGTRDEDVYQRLSERMRDRYDIFGNLPDVIDDNWIDDIETLDQKLSEFIESRRRANAFELRYGNAIDPKGPGWETCSQVLARQDIIDKLSKPW